MQQMRGVNLGGWLVLERWITPSLFAGTDATDEYTLCGQHRELAEERIEQHRSAFITQQTIADIATRGLDTVRLPVGHWLFGKSEPYIAGADTYVDQLFEWCDEYGIGVILDIHGAPGSQNGWDHSGRAGEIGWGNGNTVQETLDFLEAVVDRYGDKRALRALEVLNEPHWDVPIGTLLAYYRQAYQLVRARYSDLTVVMSDGFRGEVMAKKLQKERFDRVILDVHLYQLYTEEDRALDFHGHIRKTTQQWPKLLKKLTKRMPVLVGEWSAAMHEMYLPLQQPEHVKSYTQFHYDEYFHAQRKVFDEASASWTYWTAKTERGGPWSLLDNSSFDT